MVLGPPTDIQGSDFSDYWEARAETDIRPSAKNGPFLLTVLPKCWAGGIIPGDSGDVIEPFEPPTYVVLSHGRSGDPRMFLR